MSSTETHKRNCQQTKSPKMSMAQDPLAQDSMTNDFNLQILLEARKHS